MLVSVEEFRRYMGGLEVSPGLEQELVSLLLGVQQQLETYLNRPVELVQVREVALTDGLGNLYLSVSPVRKVISYGVSVASHEAPEVSWSPYEITLDSSLGIDTRIIDKVSYKSAGSNYRPYGMNLPMGNSMYVIEYIAGIDGTKEEQIKLAIKRVAAREFTRNHIDTIGLRTGNIESTEVGDTRNIGWSVGELQSLQRFRRRIVR